jgi:hypothetical protein
MEKHYFKPDEENENFCEICGKKFRDTGRHFTVKDLKEKYSKEPYPQASVASKADSSNSDDNQNKTT